MPETASPAQSVLEALGFALFAREDSGALRLSGEPPAWLDALWPALGRNDGILPIEDASPFLENFLVDAEACWKKGGQERAQSGPWIEQDATGAEVELDASAMTIQGQPILLIERLGEAFAAKKAALQHARETAIANQRLNSEIQKKQILLHSVANDLRAGLANIITSLRLIEMEKKSERITLLLHLALRAGDGQLGLIERILSAFRKEMGSSEEGTETQRHGAPWHPLLRRALDSAEPLFAEKKVRLETPGPILEEIWVAGEPGQLERMMGNLLQDALERSEPGSRVIVRAKEEPESLLVSVEDSGPIMGSKVCQSLFGAAPGGDLTPASAMRLQFCRIVVEDCGGELDCAPLHSGGNRLSVRLTKSAALG
jgi:signal transduction histidine kinase